MDGDTLPQTMCMGFLKHCRVNSFWYLGAVCFVDLGCGFPVQVANGELDAFAKPPPNATTHDRDYKRSVPRSALRTRQGAVANAR